jgi:hypothetical protein
MTTTKRRSRPSEPPRQTVVWTCHECNDVALNGVTAIFTHLWTVHGVTATTEGEQRVLSHADDPTHYVWCYEWIINGLRFTETVTTERSAEGKEVWQ